MKQRAFNVNIMGERAYTIGGDKAGRFYSSGTTYHKRRKSVAKGHSRAKLAIMYIKLVFCLTLFSSAWFLCYMNNQPKPTTPVEAAEPLPLNGATSFEQVAPTSDEQVRDTEAREVVRGDLFDTYFGKDARIMRAVCESESGFVTPSINKTLNRDKSWDVGWCQINLQAHWDKIGGTTKSEKVDWLLIPENNVKTAKVIFDDSGFYPWSDFKNGKYKEHLK